MGKTILSFCIALAFGLGGGLLAGQSLLSNSTDHQQIANQHYDLPSNVEMQVPVSFTVPAEVELVEEK